MTTLVRPAAAPTANRQPWIRLARPADRPLLEAMHRRCGPASRYHRWHAPLPAIPERYLAGALAGSAEHIALVATCRPAGSIVAIASAVRQHGTSWEIGILVEDAHQRRGIGNALLGRLLKAIPDCAELHADLLTERAGLLRTLGRLGPVRVDWDGEVVHAVVELAGRPVIRPNGRPG